MVGDALSGAAQGRVGAAAILGAATYLGAAAGQQCYGAVCEASMQQESGRATLEKHLKPARAAQSDKPGGRIGSHAFGVVQAAIKAAAGLA